MLSGLLLYQCDASDAVFDGAELQGSTINECFLPSASFRFAKLSQVTITKTHLADCSFFQSKGDYLSIVRPTIHRWSCLARCSSSVSETLKVERADSGESPERPIR
ncbi:pentapeptide repeat-containing protein [Bradyrhizobium ottawaense]